MVDCIYLCAFQSWLLSIVILWSRFHFSDFSTENYYTTFSKWWSAHLLYLHSDIIMNPSGTTAGIVAVKITVCTLSLWWCQSAELFDLSLSLYQLHTFLIISFRHLLIHTENYYETIP